MSSFLVKPIKIVICLGLMIYILTSLDYSRFALIQKRFHYSFVFLLLGTLLLEDFVKAGKWRYLLRLQGIRLKTTEILHVDYTSRFMNLFVPSTVAQDCFRFFGLAKAVPEKESILSSILMDRFLGMLSLVAFVTFGAVFSLGDGAYSKAILPIAAAILGVLSVLLAALFFRPVGNIAKACCDKMKDVRYLSFGIRVIESLLRYCIHPSGLAFVFSICVAVQFLRILRYFFSALALSFFLPFWKVICFSPIVTFLSMLPISISGIGVREMSFAFFFTQAGVPTTEAFLIPALVTVTSLLFSILPGGILIMLRGVSAHKAG